MTTQTTLHKIMAHADAYGDALFNQGLYQKTDDQAPEIARKDLVHQVEALVASQNKCGSGAGCLYKEALIDSLTEERDALARTKASDQAAYIAMRDQRDEALKLAADRLVDSERYRWLRGRVPGGTYRVIGVIYSEGGSGVDAAIDAAMQAEKEAR